MGECNHQFGDWLYFKFKVQICEGVGMARKCSLCGELEWDESSIKITNISPIPVF